MRHRHLPPRPDRQGPPRTSATDKRRATAVDLPTEANRVRNDERLGMLEADVLTMSLITFNDLLRKAGYSLASVRFLRHQEQGTQKGRSVYEL